MPQTHFDLQNVISSMLPIDCNLSTSKEKNLDPQTIYIDCLIATNEIVLVDYFVRTLV